MQGKVQDNRQPGSAADDAVAQAKRRSAQAALQYVRDGMVVGLGTGSTADFFLAALGQAIAASRLRNVSGVPTSRQSESRARQFGIPIVTLAECLHPDVTIDGADEVAPNLDLIKGLGGALVREKIVAQNSKRLIIIVDQAKLVDQLGSKSPLPVEVTTFGHETQAAFLRSLGAEPVLRLAAAGKPLVTDNGNFIYDCRFSGITAPQDIETALRRRAGIVGTGLFLQMAERVIIGTASGVEERVQRQ